MAGKLLIWVLFVFEEISKKKTNGLRLLIASFSLWEGSSLASVWMDAVSS